MMAVCLSADELPMFVPPLYQVHHLVYTDVEIYDDAAPESVADHWLEPPDIDEHRLFFTRMFCGVVHHISVLVPNRAGFGVDSRGVTTLIFAFLIAMPMGHIAHWIRIRWAIRKHGKPKT